MKRTVRQPTQRGASVPDVLRRLAAQGTSSLKAGYSGLGIRPTSALGVPVPAIRRLSRELGKDHVLARGLWASGVHEARILALLIAEPARLTTQELERWVTEIDTWDLCDHLCVDLLRFAADPWPLVRKWVRRDEEFVKRAALVLIATMAIHAVDETDQRFQSVLPLISPAATDPRPFVRKAAGWALRQIGKRNPALCRDALKCAELLVQSENSSQRWVGNDVRRELLRTSGRASRPRSLPNMS